jgi:hypothetical protein
MGSVPCVVEDNNSPSAEIKLVHSQFQQANAPTKTVRLTVSKLTERTTHRSNIAKCLLVVFDGATDALSNGCVAPFGSPIVVI